MVCRVEKSADYTVMSNNHLRNKELSLKAKGLLSVVLSLPDGWDYSIAGLVAICKESTGAVQSALDELKKHGYLEIRKIYPDKTASGRIEYEYIFRETPENVQPAEEQAPKKQEVEKQGLEFQGVEFQEVENHVQLNTKKSNTKKSNTKKEYIELIVKYLNDHAGTRYRPDSPETVRLLTKLLNLGYCVADITEVIDKKISEWQDTDFAKYLRPSTLFDSKFESYLNAPVKSSAPDAIPERYAPTYDIGEIENLLHEEEMQYFGGDADE